MPSGTDRTALVTGVSRRVGIGNAIARRLAEDGYQVLATGWHAHDQEMEWPADPEGPKVLTELHPTIQWIEADLALAEAPAQLIDDAVERFGPLNVIVAAHGRSSHQSLARVTADELDRCFATNARSCVLLAQRFNEVFDPERGHGRLMYFTSGQHIGPMADEIAYAVSKGALHQMTATLSDALIDRGITVNCINPGPVDTGYLEGDLHQQVAQMFPAGRWGQVEDVANLVSWLASPQSAWVTGQVIDSEGGFRRWARLDRFD